MYRIAVGCDHAGFALKQRLADVLRDLGHEVSDLGAHSADRVDYPDSVSYTHLTLPTKA